MFTPGRAARARALAAAVVVAAMLLSAAAAGPVRYRDVIAASAERTENIPFRTATTSTGTSASLTLDLYQPAGDTERARPAILWIHGGGFRPGNDKRQKYIVAMAEAFAKRGYVGVAPDYRVRETVDPDRVPALRDALEDCRAALDWVRGNAAAYRIDPLRIAIGGGSAGGMIAVNLAALDNAASKAGTRGVFALVDLWGSPAKNLLVADIAASFPPTLIIHGTADQTVPFSQSEALAAMLKVRGIEHRLYPIPGAAHTPTSDMERLIEETAAFLFRTLPAAPAAAR